MSNTKLVQSLLRGLDILEMVARSENGLNLKTIADRLGVKPPTAHNLARTLVSRGYLEKGARAGDYRIGLAPWEILSAWSSRESILRAENAIQSAAASCSQATLSYAEVLGGQMFMRLRLGPDRPGTLTRPAYRPMSPYGSASSLVFLAYCTEEERAEFFERFSFIEYGVPIWKSQEDLLAALQQARERGYAELSRQKSERFPIAAPVWNARGEIIGALGASVPKNEYTRSRRDDLIRTVLSAAESVSESAPVADLSGE